MHFSQMGQVLFRWFEHASDESTMMNGCSQWAT